METFSFTNRYGLKIVGDILIPKHSIGLAFVMHGLGGFRHQKHLQLLAQTLLDNHYTVVNFDCTNSIGDSEGRYEDATMQLHYEDLCDVIAWSKKQSWYTAPYVLVGHSMGAYAVARYAEEYPTEVKAVFPHATVVSGELSFKAHEKFKLDETNNWRQTGWTHRTSSSKPGVEMRLPWSHMEERLLHDLQPKAQNITMPVLFVVGEKDEPCPPDHEKILYDMIPGPKEIHVVPDAGHTFKTPEQLDILKTIFDAWLHRLPVITSSKESLIAQLQSQGFAHVYAWTDAPGATYAAHAHRGRVTLYICKGSVTFSGGTEATLIAGDRFDVSPGVEHVAHVGAEGCEYIVGEEIEGDS